MHTNYKFIKSCSKTDNLIISEIPELPGCIAYGNIEFESIDYLESLIFDNFQNINFSIFNNFK